MTQVNAKPTGLELKRIGEWISVKCEYVYVYLSTHKLHGYVKLWKSQVSWKGAASLKRCNFFDSAHAVADQGALERRQTCAVHPAVQRSWTHATVITRVNKQLRLIQLTDCFLAVWRPSACQTRIGNQTWVGDWKNKHSQVSLYGNPILVCLAFR